MTLLQTVELDRWRSFNVTDGAVLSLASCFIRICVPALPIKINLVTVNVFSILFYTVLYLVQNS